MKLFVWDFHGVLEQDNDLALIEVTDIILEKNGFKERLDLKVRNLLYGRRWYEYFEYILPNESYSTHMDLTCQSYIYNDSHPEVATKYIKPANWAEKVLSKIKEKKHDQLLISNTNIKSLDIYLELVNLRKFFPDKKIFGTDSHRNRKPKRKMEYLEDYLKNKKFDEIIIIGDALEEWKMADKLRTKFYQYAHEGRSFRQCPTCKRIIDLRDILAEI
jgi:phosphoglycolate phosphatase-like HAD superfamily hydrolase